MGLFWSMRPASPSNTLGLDSRPVATVRVTALQGRKVVATAEVVRRTRLAAVERRDTTLAEEGFVGRLYEPPSTGSRPGILHIGGSEGGLPSGSRPGLLASHGYPTLALAYFGEPGLPRDLSEIPLEYFARALEWLGRQRGVDPARLVIYGGSRGAEAALLLGSVYPGLVQAVAAYAPSSVVNPGFPNGGPAWTLGGRPVPYVGIEEFGIPDPPGYPQAVIPVEKIAGPIFLVAGTSDLLWPSAPYANAIARRLRAHGRTDVTLLEYDRAGHAVAFAVPNLPAFTYAGGTRRDDAAARSHSWPRFLRFLADAA